MVGWKNLILVIVLHCFFITSSFSFFYEIVGMYVRQDGGALNYIQPEVMSSSLPMRLVDYFLVLGVGGFKVKSNGRS